MSPSSAPLRASRAVLRTLALSLVLGALLVTATAASATTRMWNNPAGGAWSDAASWSPAGVPGAGDVANLGVLDGPYTVTLDVDPQVDALTLMPDATLDATIHRLDAVGQLHNAGTITNFRGAYDGARFSNDAGGVIQVAPGDSLVTGGDITNNGTIAIGPDLASALYLTSQTTIGGSGRIVLSGHARVNNPLPRPEHDIWLVNGSSHTFSGAGDVWAPIENHGTILQDHSQGAKLVLHEYLYNYGTVMVSDSAMVQVDCPLVKQFGGRIVGHDGSFFVMMPFDVGGTVDCMHGGSFVASGGQLWLAVGSLVEASIERDGGSSGSGAVVLQIASAPNFLTVQAGAELRVAGLMDVSTDSSSIYNHGTVTVSGTLNMHPQPGHGMFLAGDGQLVLDNGTLGCPDGGIIVNLPGHTIRGCGTIAANLDNQGTIDLDCSSYFPSTINGGTLTNRTLLHVKRGILTFKGGAKLVNRGAVDGDGGQIKIQDGASVDNTAGTFRAGSNHVFFGDRKSAATFVGGTLTTNGVGLYQNLGQTTLQDVTLDATATFKTWNGATTRATGAAFLNKGLNQVEAGGAFTVDPATSYAPAGGSTLLDGGTLTVPNGYTVDGLLKGYGTIVGNVTNAGLIQPTVSGSDLVVQGNLRQARSGRVAFDIAGAGTGQYARLSVTGAAALDGHALVSTVGGYTPVNGTAFPVMAFASHAGAFTDLTADPALGLSLAYLPTALTLQSTSLVGVGGALPTALSFAARGDRFALALPAAARVTVVAYTVDGRSLGTLLDAALPAGANTVGWGALRAAPTSGIYFARATVRFADRTETRTARALILR